MNGLTGDTDEFRNVGAAVDDKIAGLRVDLYLAKFFPFRSREAWARACRDAELRVNGQAVKPSYKLRPGDCVARFHPLAEEPAVDTNLHVLGEFDGILAVFKPGNLPMHEAGKFRRNTFAHAVGEQFGTQWAAVHRLDRETSGIVLCAAQPRLRAALSEAFVLHRVRKEYLAIVVGAPEHDCWTVDHPIDCPIDTRTARMNLAANVARDACTRFQTEGRAGDVALLRAFPLTGRTNQIRVHLQHCGLPIVGDLRFGLGRDRPGVERHFLHATRLVLRHPQSGEELRIECPLPLDMQDFWDAQVGATIRS